MVKLSHFLLTLSSCCIVQTGTLRSPRQPSSTDLPDRYANQYGRYNNPQFNGYNGMNSYHGSQNGYYGNNNGNNYWGNNQHWSNANNNYGNSNFNSYGSQNSYQVNPDYSTNQEYSYGNQPAAPAYDTFSQPQRVPAPAPEQPRKPLKCGISNPKGSFLRRLERQERRRIETQEIKRQRPGDIVSSYRFMDREGNPAEGSTVSPRFERSVDLPSEIPKPTGNARNTTNRTKSITEPEVEDRIVGGEELRISLVPWQISLRYHGDHICGGALIDKYHMVTAAHCFDNRSKHRDVWTIYAGKSRIPVDEMGEVGPLPIFSITIHENYNNLTAYDSDIALLQLENPVKFVPEVFPICLPYPNSNTQPSTYAKCYVSGYGDTQNTGGKGKLKAASLPILSNSNCGTATRYGHLSKNMLCAGVLKGGKGSCQGDSGGPLSCFKNGHYFLEGIVSFGYECAGVNSPSVYTRVANFVDWISNTSNQQLQAMINGEVPSPNGKGFDPDEPNPLDANIIDDGYNQYDVVRGAELNRLYYRPPGNFTTSFYSSN